VPSFDLYHNVKHEENLNQNIFITDYNVISVFELPVVNLNQDFNHSCPEHLDEIIITG
jgi:hypothetical protein